MTGSGDATGTPVERAWRDEWLRIVAGLARRLGDLQLAEDATAEAFAVATVRWPDEGVPDKPGAWLWTTAWRKALDTLRRERRTLVGLPGDIGVGADPSGALGGQPHGRGDPWTDLATARHGPVEDDVLRLVLACCHPALAPEARVALTLRHVVGLTTGEIATAFLVPEQTMAKRLVRARSKIREARITFELPEPLDLPARLADVHAAVYLTFAEGHLASGDGPPVRRALCDEAVWLARQLHALVPDDAETTGLLALLLLQHAREPARLDPAGQLVAFDEQDRSLWDRAAIDEALALLARTGGEHPGQYQLQAAIAALHATAPADDVAHWARVVELFDLLRRVAPSPVVELNRAVAVGRAEGPAAGLAALAPILADGRLERTESLHAVHADLLERAGDAAGAARAWERATAHAASIARAEALRRRAAALPWS